MALRRQMRRLDLGSEELIPRRSGCPRLSPYIDTSALAKRYLNEPGSDAFDAFLGALRCALISRLTVVELRCLFLRWRRAGEIDDKYERAARAGFADDVRSGYFEVEPLDRSPCDHLRTT